MRVISVRRLVGRSLPSHGVSPCSEFYGRRLAELFNSASLLPAAAWGRASPRCLVAPPRWPTPGGGPQCDRVPRTRCHAPHLQELISELFNSEMAICPTHPVPSQKGMAYLNKCAILLLRNNGSTVEQLWNTGVRRGVGPRNAQFSCHAPELAVRPAEAPGRARVLEGDYTHPP